ncbi:polysaccharide deacetylase family protein [Alkalihalobacillus sp. MEB130]|uniref:polysaccharide deacetylase family protein n=1 Tax=Alkalihalobacillus sp. MEB130 TaxID=2976704 RepID=UPI0028E06183|nr:polysaccharide deacetylase family protein [Alkalihalobacillus sp. MEB130]MDT8863068.1 polysaccharide deacetylase family protein [Alkalihalobacillus sp. MEB130]
MLKKVTVFMTISFMFLPLFHKPVLAETYIVQSGDTLADISGKYGISEEEIVNHNRLLSTILEPGQHVEIPYTFTREVLLPKLLLEPKIIRDLQWLYFEQRMNEPNKMIYMGDSSRKQIALTFDDGPEKTYTPQILEILRDKEVKATFFVVGKMAKEYPEQLKQMYEEGHVIGNHTWDHPYITELTDEQLIENVQSTNEEIEKITGFKPNLFRPPFGEMEDRQAGLLHQQGYRTIMWTADTKDWSGVPAEKIVSTVKQEARPGVIVLQHNYHVEGEFDTVQALPEIIDDLKAEGYEFVTVPTLLGE